MKTKKCNNDPRFDIIHSEDKREITTAYRKGGIAIFEGKRYIACKANGNQLECQKADGNIDSYQL